MFAACRDARTIHHNHDQSSPRQVGVRAVEQLVAALVHQQGPHAGAGQSARVERPPEDAGVLEERAIGAVAPTVRTKLLISLGTPRFSCETRRAVGSVALDELVENAVISTGRSGCRTIRSSSWAGSGTSQDLGTSREPQCRVGATRAVPRSTRETVAIETPACSATW